MPSPQGLGEFLACSCVLENRTIFKDIAVMPAASRWIFGNGELKQKETYFRSERVGRSRHRWMRNPTIRACGHRRRRAFQLL